MDVLIFCHENDLPMHSLLSILETKGVEVLLITDKDLAMAKAWHHGCNKFGKFETHLVLMNGILIDFSRVKCIVNRILQIPMHYFMDTQDKLYAEMEMYALFMSVLRSNESKLLFPFTCHNITNSQSNNRFYVLQEFIKAGLPINTSYWTTNPSLQYQNENQIPFKLTLYAQEKKRRKTIFEMLNKEPTVFLEAYQGIGISECICSEMVDPDPMLTRYTGCIAKFLQSLKSVMVVLKYGLANGELKFINADLFPKNLSDKALYFLSEKILQKNQNHDTRSRNTHRIARSISY